MGSERLIENSNPEVLNVRIKHNPYLDKTEMWINNEEIEQDDALFQNRYPDHFKEWVGALPIGLHKEFHANVLNITFCGLQKDKRILQRAFKAAQSKNIIEKAIIHYQSAILYDEFIEKSFASYVLDDVAAATLHSDTRFYSLLGDDRTRVAFFKALW